MCIIAYKPSNVDFPSDTILKNCWESNPDMGGFMYALNGSVHIEKGFETWEAFKHALDKARVRTGNNVPYVMHFRISTQGYDVTCCHPFPLTSKMKNFRKMNYVTNIGVAHNGILRITSDGAKDYSDTMKFITDYLSLIIRSYKWYEDERTKQLIENLIDGSRLAILDKTEHCELLGKGWIEDGGIWYSNSTYKTSRYPKHLSYYNDDYDYSWWGGSFFEKYYNYKTGLYDFNEINCPLSMNGSESYCMCCAKYGKCQLLGQFDANPAEKNNSGNDDYEELVRAVNE